VIRQTGLTFCIVCAFVVATAAQAEIYMFRDARGVTHFADRPLGPGYRLYHSSFASSGLSRKRARGGRIPASVQARRKRYTDLVDQVARRYALDSALLHAVITAESAYNPYAVSRKGALGLMQLMPATAQRYGVNDAYNPEENVHGGAHYLRDLLEMFDADLRLALAAYNAGENAVLKYGKQIPPYEETRNYVVKVMDYYRQYRQVN
jgi:soluble lytic murein transglycosylase-like protein